MGMAEPLEPGSNFEPPPSSAPGSGHADWLVGAEEGVEAELQNKAQPEVGARPVPKLFRPGVSEGVESGTVVPMPTVPAPSRPSNPFGTATNERPSGAWAAPPGMGASDFTKGSGMSWEPGANSVPAMRRRAQRSAVPPEPTRDFPMDDAEERTRASALVMEAAAAAAEAVARPHDVVEPESFDVPTSVLPWWRQASESFRTDRRLQILAGLGVLALLTIAFFPRAEPGISLAELRKHPDRFDGQNVKVNGKVGEVFPVGGGYAFYLHQARDTMVVFTRVRTPQPRQNVKLTGHVSTGYLDGQPRLALFESTKPAKK